MGVLNSLVKEGFLKLETPEGKEPTYLPVKPFVDTIQPLLQEYEKIPDKESFGDKLPQNFTPLQKKKLLEKKFVSTSHFP